MNTVSVNGAELCYEDRGGGPTLLLVHGFPLDRTMWADLARFFADNSHSSHTSHPSHHCVPHRLIIPDLRGFGGSPPRGAAVSMELFADDLAALLDALAIHEPVVLCGLSMGGYVALQFWRKYRGAVAGAGPLRHPRGRRLTRGRESPGHPRRALAARGIGAAGRVDAAAADGRSDAARAARTARSFAADDFGLRPAGRRRRAAGHGRPTRHDRRARRDRVLHAAHCRAGGRRHSAGGDARHGPRDSGAKCVEIPAAGHLAPLENPAAVAAVLAEFLQGID